MADSRLQMVLSAITQAITTVLATEIALPTIKPGRPGPSQKRQQRRHSFGCVGAARRLNAIESTLLERMVWPWILAIPFCAALAYGLLRTFT